MPEEPSENDRPSRSSQESKTRGIRVRKVRTFGNLIRRIQSRRKNSSQSVSKEEVSAHAKSAPPNLSENARPEVQNRAKTESDGKDKKMANSDEIKASNVKKMTRQQKLTLSVEKLIQTSSGDENQGDYTTNITTADDTIYDKLKDPRICWSSMILEQGALYVMKLFRKVRRFKPPNVNAVAFKANHDKNRYTDIICNDNTRVVLRNHSCDYIHANWITSPKGTRFICTQGPMKNTLSDFWHMILQEDCRTIVMLCSLEEDNKSKCTKYYPDSASSPFTIDKTTVTLVDQNMSEKSGLMSSLWKVKHREREFELRHLQYTNWVDHLAPKDTHGVIELHRELSKSPEGRPIVVHCSAGVGRTCTLVGIELLLEQANKLNSTSGVTLVKKMRESRMGAVQKSIQFLFMHYVVLDVFCQDGLIRSDDRRLLSFREVYGQLLDTANKLRLESKNNKVHHNKKPSKKSSEKIVEKKEAGLAKAEPKDKVLVKQVS
ncbi:hypothetical protein RB195_002130 [Necator americanus]|uniref:Protein-tyrosine phosphatase n=1 Tax=Necator americanus TaxID=51031 RepID=A0ABR1DIJ2_NECAM